MQLIKNVLDWNLKGKCKRVGFNFEKYENGRVGVDMVFEV